MAGDLCDCCRRSEQKVLGVASSGLGAISFAFCAECIHMDAEPEMMFEFMWDMCDGNPKDLHESMNAIRTFKDGVFLPWLHWVEWRLTQPPLDPLRWEKIMDTQAPYPTDNHKEPDLPKQPGFSMTRGDE